jgi:hypothetical protein
MSAYVKKLIEKWKPILVQEGLNPISNPKVARNTAIMLENQYRYSVGGVDLNEGTTWSPGGPGTSTTGSMDPGGQGYVGNAEFHNIAIPMVRRTFPELVAHEVVGVQPMNQPVGLAFAMRFIADQEYGGNSNVELGYNNIDPYYSGTNASSGVGYDDNYPGAMSTQFGEALGSNTVADVGGYPGIGGGLGIGTGRGIKEVSMTIEKDVVEAKTRKLRSKWSVEVAQDIKAMHGLELEDEMMDLLAYEITAEIDRELITKMRALAVTNNASGTWSYSAADGRWEHEKYRNFYNLLVRKANRIIIDTRRGAGNFVIASPELCAMLQASANFSISPVNTDIDSSIASVSRVGSIDGRLTVYRDTFATDDDVIIGYKGASEYDTGIVYLPYIQLMQQRATFEDSFQPTAGILSRYAIHDHLFGSNLFYIRIEAEDLTY